MNTVPRISDTEWEIMRVVWAKHPVTGNEIIDALTAADPQWHPKTVRTLLARLVQKKAVDYEAHGRTYVYSPLVTEEECVASASQSFVDRVFGGSLKPMLAHFVDQQKLTVADLEEMKKMLANSQLKHSKKAKRSGHNPG